MSGDSGIDLLALLRKRKKLGVYNHARFEWRRAFCRFLLRTIGFTLIARIDRIEGLENVPKSGPAIILINHIAFIDPFVVLFVLPRNIVPMAKVEVYDYPVVGIFPRIWGVIPVRREGVDRQAIRKAIEVLEAGEIILIAPEGTRGPYLKNAKEGIAYIAGKTGVPVVPVALEGTPGFPTFRTSARWKEPGAQVRFGKPFRFKSDIDHPNRAMLKKMTDEAMIVLARLLPEKRRGEYALRVNEDLETVEFIS